MKGLVAGLAAFALAVVAPTAWLALDGYRALVREERVQRENALARAKALEDRLARDLEAEFARRIAAEDLRSDVEFRPSSLGQGKAGLAVVVSPLAGGDPVPGFGPYFDLGPEGLSGPREAPRFEEGLVRRLERTRLAAEVAWFARGLPDAQVVESLGQQGWNWNPWPGQAKQEQQEQTVQTDDSPASSLLEELPERPIRIERRLEALLDLQIRFRDRPDEAFGDSGALAAFREGSTPGKNKEPGPPAVAVGYHAFRFVEAGGRRMAIRLVRRGDREVRLQGFELDLAAFVAANLSTPDAVAAPGASGAPFALAGTAWGIRVPPAGLTEIAAEAEARRRRFVAAAAFQGLVVAVGLAVLGGLVRGRIELARRRAEFVAAVSHELRTPLAGVRMHAELLPGRLAREPDRAAESLRFLRSESERMTRLVENVLSAAGIENRTKQYRFETGDLGEVVREVGDAFHDLVAEAGGDLEVRIEAGLPSVRFDRDAARRILVNLLDNAVKFSPGTPSIELSARPAPDGVSIEVADRGLGLPPGPRDSLFQRFARGEDARARSRPGTGLGLYLVAQYAAAHGARVEALDREGGGALFRVSFPA